MLKLLERIQNLDRRWVFLGMALAIVLPLLYPLSLPFKVEKQVRSIYEAVEALPPGTRVLLSADFDPSSAPELEPFYRANLHHLFEKDLKVVMISLWETAPPFVLPILREIAARHEKEEGADWAFLGYKSGKEVAIKSIGEDLLKTFPTDPQGRVVGSLPIMQGIRAARDFPLIVNVSAGNPGTREYVLQIQGQYSLNIASATTAVSGPEYIPFYKSGQLVGLSAGMVGSAQYEKLVFGDDPPPGVRLMATAAVDVLNLGHLYIIGLIVVGNIAFFLTRRGA